jgi:hypothetical protein
MTAPDPTTPENVPAEPMVPSADPADPSTDAPDDALGAPGQRAYERIKEKLAAEKAQTADLMKRLQAIEDEKLTETERLRKQATEAATHLADLQRQNALLAKGIPAELRPPSNDATPEQWAEYADQLLEWRGVAAAAPAGPAGPRPDPAQGPRPVDTQSSKDALYEQYEREMFTPPNRRK